MATRATARSTSSCASRPRWVAPAAAPTPSSCSPSATPPASRARWGVVARRAKVEAGDAAIDSEVSLSPDGHGGFLLSVGLDVTLPSIADAAAAVDLVRAAHAVCPYSNATRGNIDVVLTANGARVE
jgi:hypothetical protein